MTLEEAQDEIGVATNEYAALQKDGTITLDGSFSLVELMRIALIMVATDEVKR